jgi:NADPH:quinone reductase-like Zn-dependent oxidoreductase
VRALVASTSAAEHIDFRDFPAPTPASNEAVVRVHAVSLNRGEVNRLATAEDGTRFGWDLSGTIEHAARDGGPPEGARVVGFVMGTAWAESVAVPLTRLAEINDDLSFEKASALPVAGLTALRMLRIDPILGRRVLVTGAAGGVGRYAVQLASLAGAHVTGIVGSEERGKGLRQLGADDVVLSMDDAEGPFDVILESVGGSSLATALGKVALGGLIVTFGNSSRQQTSFNIATFYGKHAARMQGFSLLAANHPPDFRDDLRYLADLAAAGELQVDIGYEGSWNDAGAALAALRERRVDGKAVLQID